MQEPPIASVLEPRRTPSGELGVVAAGGVLSLARDLAGERDEERIQQR